MKESHKIAKYIVMFQQLAPQVQWAKAALSRALVDNIQTSIIISFTYISGNEGSGFPVNHSF